MSVKAFMVAPSARRRPVATHAWHGRSLVRLPVLSVWDRPSACVSVSSAVLRPHSKPIAIADAMRGAKGENAQLGQPARTAQRGETQNTRGGTDTPEKDL